MTNIFFKFRKEEHTQLQEADPFHTLEENAPLPFGTNAMISGLLYLMIPFYTFQTLLILVILKNPNLYTLGFPCVISILYISCLTFAMHSSIKTWQSAWNQNRISANRKIYKKGMKILYKNIRCGIHPYRLQFKLSRKLQKNRSDLISFTSENMECLKELWSLYRQTQMTLLLGKSAAVTGTICIYALTCFGSLILPVKTASLILFGILILPAVVSITAMAGSLHTPWTCSQWSYRRSDQASYLMLCLSNSMRLSAKEQ